MGEFNVVAVKVEGPSILPGANHVALNVVNGIGDRIGVLIPTEQAQSAAVGLAIVADKGMEMKGLPRPAFNVEKIARGLGFVPTDMFAQSMWLPGGGVLSFQFGRQQAEELRSLLTIFLDGDKTQPVARH